MKRVFTRRSIIWIQAHEERTTGFAIGGATEYRLSGRASITTETQHYQFEDEKLLGCEHALLNSVIICFIFPQTEIASEAPRRTSNFYGSAKMLPSSFSSCIVETWHHQLKDLNAMIAVEPRSAPEDLRHSC
jgi:hypothetical protein